MFLSAMLSLGCVGLACSARPVNLSSLPDWYHTHAPAQIGHTTPFPLELGFVGVVACVFDTPCNVRPLRSSWLMLAQPFAPAEQPIASNEAPRGPPFRST
jgi:hypothetical protein